MSKATPDDASSAPSPPATPETQALSWESVFYTYLPALVLALGTGIALPAIPVLAKSFDLGFGAASFVVTSFLLGGLVGSLPTGWLLDRIGRRPIMIAGPLLTSAMALMTFFAQSFPELLIYRFLDGWAAQMWLLARLASISHHASANQRGRQVSWMYSMDTVGRLAGPVVGGLIALWWGPRSPFAAYAVFALIALIPSLKMAEDVPTRQAASTGDSAPARAMTVAEIMLPRLAFFGVAFFSAIARGPIFADVLHLYAAFAYNLDAAAIGLLAGMASAIGLPIGFLAGWLMDRYGRKVTMVPGFLGVTVTMVLVAVTAAFGLSLGWYVAAFLAAVTAQALTGGSIQTIGADVAPPNARGMFLGLWRFTAQVGTTISPLLFALLAEWSGYGVAFMFIAGAAFVTLLLLVTHIPETARASTPSAAAASR